MPRFTGFVCLLIIATYARGQSPAVSDPVAVSLATKSVAALTGGNVIIDTTLNTNVISILGVDSETGTAVFQAKGLALSRVDLNLSSGNRTDVRNLTNGIPAGAWAKNGSTAGAYALHNAWTDAAWFFPALSSLSQTANANFIFRSIGQEQHGGLSTQHIQVYLTQLGIFSGLQHLSTLDIYLDPISFLPLAIGFNVHPDNDMNTDIPSEIRFAKYQAVNGVQVPFHFQRIFNGNVVLDATVTSATVNTGLQDSLFTLP